MYTDCIKRMMLNMLKLERNATRNAEIRGPRKLINENATPKTLEHISWYYCI